MKVKIVKLSELKESPTLCMSPLRVFEECHKCNKVKIHFSKGKDIEDIEEIIKDMPCKPKVKKEVIDLFRRKRELLNELSEINRRLEE